MPYKYFCNNCGMKVSKKEIKRHTRLEHNVVNIIKKPIPQIDIVGEVLKELRNGEQAK